MKRKLSVLLVLLLAVGMTGCALLGTNTASSTTDNVVLTPLERAKMQSTLMMERYKAQDRDVASLEPLVMSGKASLGQVRIYRIKRNLLIKVKPLIKAFDDLIADGRVPPVERETEIFEILNAAASAAG